MELSNYQLLSAASSRLVSCDSSAECMAQLAAAAWSMLLYYRHYLRYAEQPQPRLRMRILLQVVGHCVAQVGRIPGWRGQLQLSWKAQRKSR